ncbi:cucumber peeling cupredoxin-like protein, partial [Tanacetum coccineum]
IYHDNRHVVGDALGWTIPLNGEATYTTWASQQTFNVGDTLLFNFPTGFHTVAEISQAAYGPCSSINTLSFNPIGPATVTLTRPGAHYFICTIISHCQIGQKLTINVSPARTSASSPSPLSPSSTIATPPTASEQSPSGSPVQPPLSASSALNTVASFTFLATALAFFF